MLSSRLNNQLKSSLILIIDENPSNSSVGFQVACAYACETIDNKFSKIHILLTEHNKTDWYNSYLCQKRNELLSNTIDMFDELYSMKKLEDIIPITNDKDLIIIESLPWLLLRTSESNLLRFLLNLIKSNIVIVILPYDCFEENSNIIKSLISISYITIRVETSVQFERIEAKLEQRSRTNVDTIKSTLTFSIDSQLNVINLHEEKFNNRKLKSSANTDGSSSKMDVTANLTFNLRLKDDELTAKNNLILPYTKQHNIQTSNDTCTIHYSYDKEDDIDEDEDDDLDL